MQTGHNSQGLANSVLLQTNRTPLTTIELVMHFAPSHHRYLSYLLCSHPRPSQGLRKRWTVRDWILITVNSIHLSTIWRFRLLLSIDHTFLYIDTYLLTVNKRLHFLSTLWHFLIVWAIWAHFILELLQRSFSVMVYLFVKELVFFLRVMVEVVGLVMDGEGKRKRLRVRERSGGSRERAVLPIGELVEGLEWKIKLTASSSSTHLVILLLNI